MIVQLQNINLMDYNEKWHECLREIDQYLSDKNGGRWIYDTWFSCLSFCGYDSTSDTLTLQVPSNYVCEYLDAYQVKLMQHVLRKHFGQGVRLNYRIVQNAGAPVDFLRCPVGQRPTIAIPDAEKRMRAELQRRFPNGYKWLPAHDRVARWLAGNKGRGLLCLGHNGVGKSVVCRDILPVIFEQRVTVVTAREMPVRINELTKARCVVVDDLGKEDPKRFAQPDSSFYELCDAAERNGILLIITTNLSTTPDDRFSDSIDHRYGPDVLSRLRSLVLPVFFDGSDLRM